jgi:hypothetical protein
MVLHELHVCSVFLIGSTVTCGGSARPGAEGGHVLSWMVQPNTYGATILTSPSVTHTLEYTKHTKEKVGAQFPETISDTHLSWAECNMKYN